MIKVRAFTGPTDLSPEQRVFVAQQMMKHEVPPAWRSGCAYGVDTIAARLSDAMDRHTQLYVPAAEHNRQLVKELRSRSRVIEVDGASLSSPLAYRKRNMKMVQGSDHLLAFVWKDKFYRSGEWMTINIAKKLGVPVSMVIIPNM